MDSLPEMLSMLLDGAVDVLDISEDLRKAAVDAYEEVGAWLADHGNPGCQVYPQGSFLLGTVVRPATPGGEYDIDLVIWLLLARESITQERTQGTNRRPPRRLPEVESRPGARRRAT